MTLWCASSSSMKGSYEIFGCESSPFSRVPLIEDGTLRFCHIVGDEETSHNACYLIFIGRYECVHVSTGVCQTRFNLNRYNS